MKRFSVAAALLVLATTAICSRAEAGQLFTDDFSDRKIGDGKPVTWAPGGAPSGTRDASSGDLVVTPESGRSSSSYVVGELYEDVSLHTRIHVDDDDAGYIALFARSRGDATLFGAIRPSTSGVALVGKYGGGLDYFATADQLSLNMVGSDIDLRFDLEGDQLSLWAWSAGTVAPVEPTITAVVPGTYPNSTGYIGVDVTNVGGAARKTTFRTFTAAAVPEPSGIMLACAFAVLPFVFRAGFRRRCISQGPLNWLQHALPDTRTR